MADANVEKLTQLLSAREMRAINKIKVDIGQGRYVWARVQDLTSMVLAGLVPHPMLTAMSTMFTMREASPEQLLKEMGESAGAEMLSMMRRHACQVVIEPKVTPTDDGNPEHLPADLFTMEQLLKIWTATTVVPLLSPVEAARFRPGEAAGDAEVLPAGADVQAGAEHVAEPVREPGSDAAGSLAELVHQ